LVVSSGSVLTGNSHHSTIYNAQVNVPLHMSTLTYMLSMYYSLASNLCITFAPKHCRYCMQKHKQLRPRRLRGNHNHSSN